jgi:hypothetical protein
MPMMMMIFLFVSFRFLKSEFFQPAAAKTGPREISGQNNFIKKFTRDKSR